MDKHSPVSLPINGTLDLHTFHPRDIASLLNDYIEECIKLNINSLRIIHGKGKGILPVSGYCIIFLR